MKIRQPYFYRNILIWPLINIIFPIVYLFLKDAGIVLFAMIVVNFVIICLVVILFLTCFLKNTFTEIDEKKKMLKISVNRMGKKISNYECRGNKVKLFVRPIKFNMATNYGGSSGISWRLYVSDIINKDMEYYVFGSTSKNKTLRMANKIVSILNCPIPIEILEMPRK